MDIKICPKCQKVMTYWGNASGIVYTSNPLQWDEVWVCEDCKIRIEERVRGALTVQLDVSKYELYKSPKE